MSGEEALTTGWYLDERDPTQQRYWDGSKWTHTRPVASEAAPQQPKTPPGWYPDPNLKDTQRYFDGDRWTDQRAPLELASKSSSVSLPFSTLLVFIGAAVASIGAFLPWIDASTVVPIQGNTLVQNGDGWIIVSIALATAGAAYAERANARRNWWAVIGGLVIVGLAFYYGTGDQLELTTAAGRHLADGSAGLGIYAVGFGGSAIVFGGFRED